nr:MAG TPA: hypothetical protein [Caudoviricetes sp.]
MVNPSDTKGAIEKHHKEMYDRSRLREVVVVC